MQKNQLIDLQDFERYCNVFPLFPAQNTIIIWSILYLVPIPKNQWDIEPTLIEKANQFVSFNFRDIQLLDIKNFLGGASSLEFFL